MTEALCWAFRYEALGVEPEDVDYSCEPPHDHGREASYARLEHWWDYAHAMCGLVEGHTGAHEFVAQKDIVLTFTPAGARAGGGA